MRVGISHLLLAPATFVVVAAGQCKPCGRDAIIKILKKTELAEAASAFCSRYNQPTASVSSITATETVTVTATEAVPAPTSLTTELEITTEVATEYTTIYTTVTAQPTPVRKARGEGEGDFDWESALATFAATRISSACSCIVQSPSPAPTVTETVVTVTKTETGATTVVPPTSTVVVTVTEASTQSETTTVETVIATTEIPAPPPVCAGRTELCCMGVAPWLTNSGIWGGVCGYYPTNPTELVGARCITTSSGSCPGGTIRACCASFLGGQCALGTSCQIL